MTGSAHSGTSGGFSNSASSGFGVSLSSGQSFNSQNNAIDAGFPAASLTLGSAGPAQSGAAHSNNLHVQGH